eukprot:CAMPEP_0176276806 /NCGR_PEP_ID=MMETSP0121_2-20121125/47949_1 /TAXON_ID=160619 /ORGANISM="Kryptoperidinium foliaceum, Strain CCMP 1326" /LENGTH=357 /DNA_ID=CAMNT_0017617081 /DNA_START=32 /DNA_END=1105 /DNA_ORIENTATION=-
MTAHGSRVAAPVASSATWSALAASPRSRTFGAVRHAAFLLLPAMAMSLQGCGDTTGKAPSAARAGKSRSAARRRGAVSQELAERRSDHPVVPALGRWSTQIDCGSGCSLKVSCTKSSKVGTPVGDCAVSEGFEVFPWATELPCSKFWSVIHRPFATGMLCERWLTPSEGDAVREAKLDTEGGFGMFHTALPEQRPEPRRPPKGRRRPKDDDGADLSGDQGDQGLAPISEDCGEDDCDSWVVDVDCTKASRAASNDQPILRYETARPYAEDDSDEDVFYDAQAYLELGSDQTGCKVRVACSEHDKSLQALTRCSSEVLKSSPEDFFQPGQDQTCRQLWHNLNSDGWVDEQCDQWEGIA